MLKGQGSLPNSWRSNFVFRRVGYATKSITERTKIHGVKDLRFYTQCPPIILLHLSAKLLIVLGLSGVDEKALFAQILRI